MKMLKFFLCTFWLLFSGQILGDILYTIDGKIFEGKMVAFKYDTVYFNVYRFGKFYHSNRFPLYKIWKIEFNDPKKDNLPAREEMERKYRELRRGKRLKKVVLTANQKWINTGIKVKIGSEIFFSAFGSIYIDENVKVLQVGELDLKWDRRKPMPNQPTGALIAKVGDRGTPFYVGDDKAPFPLSQEGNLYVGINDYKVDDNKGEFIVSVYY
jgi:hypothetical protein